MAFVGTERGTGCLAGGQGRVEGAEVGTQDLGASQGAIEIGPVERLRGGPLVELPVGPQDRVVVIQQHDAVGHPLQNLLILEEFADFEGLLEILRGDVDPRKHLVSQMGQGTDGVLHHHQFVRVGHVAQHRLDVLSGITDQQDSWLARQRFFTPCAAIVPAPYSQL